MRRALSHLVAAAALASVTAWMIVPAEAASRGPSAAAESGFQLVGYRGDMRHGDWNDDNRRRDGWRHERRHHHRRHRDNFFQGFGFSFGMPFAYAPQYYRAPQPDCFRDGYGRLYCSTY